MIYLDNAATTIRKPPEVAEAVIQAMKIQGNAGRGANEAALTAARKIYEVRSLLGEFFHAENPRNIVFTSNSTESLNIAIKGLIRPGDHVVTTALEHNSVLRPLYEMEDAGAVISILPADKRGLIDYEDLEKAVCHGTRAIICTHASNVTGNMLDLARIGKTAAERGCLFIVDASQTAGIYPIDVQELGIDVLCFTGHKSMLGPQGTGGMVVREGLRIRPLKTGGSGVRSFSRTHPEEMPAALEAGTLNGHGIAGLGAAAEYILHTGMDVIREKELRLAERFLEGVRKIHGITVYGDFSFRERCPVVTLNLEEWDSAEVEDELASAYGICVRSGAHCAPLMHSALGTADRGAVRFSFSHYNTEEEVDAAVTAMEEIASGRIHRM